MDGHFLCEVCEKPYNNSFESEWTLKIKSLFVYGMPNICIDCLGGIFGKNLLGKEYWKMNYGVEEKIDMECEEVTVIYRTHNDMVNRIVTKDKLNLKRTDIYKDIFIDEGNNIILVTEKGKLFIISPLDIPFSKGESLLEIQINEIVELDEDDKIISMKPLDTNQSDFLLLTTKNGSVSKFPVDTLNELASKEIMSLKEKDSVVSLNFVKKESFICLISRSGNAILFDESQVISSIKKNPGVKGMNLDKKESFDSIGEKNEIVGVLILNDLNNYIAIATQNGYGFKFSASCLRIQKRGGKGNPIIHLTEKNGEIIHTQAIKHDEAVFLYFVSNKNNVFKMLRELPIISVNSQGVMLISIKDKQEKLVLGYPISMNPVMNVVETSKIKEKKQSAIDSVKDLYNRIGVLPTSSPDTLIPQLKKQDYIPALKFYKGFSKTGKIKALIGNWYQLLADSELIKLEKMGKYGILCVAKDGHVCRSLQEKFIDDWLFEHKIKHDTEPVYPYHKELNTSRMRADFKVGDVWIEYFGLNTKLYREKMEKKRELSRLKAIHLVELFPEDMSRKKMQEKLGFLLEDRRV